MLKVGSPQSSDINPEPPLNMNSEPPMLPQQDNMGDSLPPMDGNDEMDNQFDTNFDAGIDADEEKDPRNYIEKLSGKLSKKLYDYNKNQAQPDSELSKYVCGMIIAQAIKGLSQEDVDEILSKIKSDEVEDENFDNNVNNEESSPVNNETEPLPNNMANEGKKREDKINEIFQDIINPQKIENNIEIKKNYKHNNFSTKPYTSPVFK